MASRPRHDRAGLPGERAPGHRCKRRDANRPCRCRPAPGRVLRARVAEGSDRCCADIRSGHVSGDGRGSAYHATTRDHRSRDLLARQRRAVDRPPSRWDRTRQRNEDPRIPSGVRTHRDARAADRRSRTGNALDAAFGLRRFWLSGDRAHIPGRRLLGGHLRARWERVALRAGRAQPSREAGLPFTDGEADFIVGLSNKGVAIRDVKLDQKLRHALPSRDGRLIETKDGWVAVAFFNDRATVRVCEIGPGYEYRLARGAAQGYFGATAPLHFFANQEMLVVTANEEFRLPIWETLGRPDQVEC